MAAMAVGTNPSKIGDNVAKGVGSAVKSIGSLFTGKNPKEKDQSSADSSKANTADTRDPVDEVLSAQNLPDVKLPTEQTGQLMQQSIVVPGTGISLNLNLPLTHKPDSTTAWNGANCPPPFEAQNDTAPIFQQFSKGGNSK